MHRLFTNPHLRKTCELCKTISEIDIPALCDCELLTDFPTRTGRGEQVLFGCVHEKAAGGRL
jgi:hypothetical protein